jgi:hypothetical protein
LNLLGAADLEEIFFIILPLKTHLKMVFPNVTPIALPPTHDFKILIVHYIRQLFCKFELFWLNNYSKEDF